MKRLKTLYEEQNTKYAAQQEELAIVKRMVAMILAGKQLSIENNQECDV